MSDQPAVLVEDLRVTYRTNVDRKPTLRRRVALWGKEQSTVKEIEAVKGVSFEVPEQEIMGIVGANGAGKSTILKTIAGILPPSEGRVTVRGEVTTLLTLGLGFNSELSGRENIRLGGLATGFTLGDLAEREAEIVDFADIGDFIDYPMRTYSSGMYGRLAFSVAVHMDPDILIIDEALSAGDAAFKKKASQKIEDLIATARAILLVSHSLGLVSELATSCLWLDKGLVKAQGDPNEVIDAYTTSAGA